MAKKRRKPQNAVLFHHPDAVDTSRPQLMGRHAAGEGFLKAFVQHSGVDGFHGLGFEPGHFEDFQRRIGAVDDQDRPCHWADLDGMAGAGPKTLMLPDPSLAPFAWRRRGTGNRGYSLCGLNHTIASEKVMDSFGDLMTAPLQPWDALICTSNPVKATITRIFDNWGDYMNQRTGGKIKPAIQLPVIPLGVDCDDYADGDKAQSDRQTIRRGLGIGEDDVAVLFLGRLSFHAKAHPTPLYLSLEEAAKRCKKKLHLIQAGWFSNDAIEKEFREGLRAFCPSVNGIFLDGREPDIRFRVWFAADIFSSLSDNIQETFGLTPIQAMAAGLPAVVSDWDGYRDTVRPGVDGFTVPTWMPLPQSGGDLALAPETHMVSPIRDREYDKYLGLVSQCTSVDVAAAADAFATLASDKNLRRQMGEAGRQRARETFDWRVVVAAYQQLWRDLENIRNREKELVPVKKNSPALPLRDDPFSVFEAFPSHTLDGDTVVSLAPGIGKAKGKDKGKAGDWAERLEAVRSRFMNVFAADALLDAKDQEAMLKKIEQQGSLNVYALAEVVAEERLYMLARTVAWLAKMGIVGLRQGPGPDAVKTKGKKKKGKPGKAADLAPESGSALVNLGIAQRRRGAVGQAVKYFRRALENDPDDPLANNQLGELLAFAGKLDEAGKCFETALKKSPGYHPAQRNQGQLKFMKGDYAAAVSALAEAAKAAPEDVETKYLLGICCRYAGSPEDAAGHLVACLEADAGRADAWVQLGLARNHRDDTGDSREAFEKALVLDPQNVPARAAVLSLEAEKTGRRNIVGNLSGKKIGLYIHAKHHFPLLKPLFDAFAENNWVHLSTDIRDLADFGPEVAIVCDAPLERLKAMAPETTTINVRHGMAGRNFARRWDRHADYNCVSSKMERDEIVAAGAMDGDRIWITGFPGNDPMFRGDPVQLSVGGDRKTVLYAPTHHRAFTSAAMLGERAASLIGGAREDLDLVIKPHPRTCEFRQGWISAWEGLAARDAHVHLVKNPAADIAPLLTAADVLVSDASGVIFQYLALDRPIVLITNPQHALDKERFDADAVEWQWRDVGEEVTDVADLAAAVDRALADPGKRAGKRAEYRKLLFDDLTDGGAVRRIVEEVSGL